MFRKLKANDLHRFINQSKRFFHGAYSGTKNIFKDIDSGINLAKEVYSILSPVISDVAGVNLSKLDNAVGKGIGGYNDVRNKVIDSHDKVEGAYNRIRNLR